MLIEEGREHPIRISQDPWSNFATFGADFVHSELLISMCLPTLHQLIANHKMYNKHLTITQYAMPK